MPFTVYERFEKRNGKNPYKCVGCLRIRNIDENKFIIVIIIETFTDPETK